MNFRTSAPTNQSLREPENFSLVLGGPLFQLLLRARLTDDVLGLMRRRVIIISLIAWLPLLVLSTLNGQALGHNVTVPFLPDIETHIRFLVVVPLLLIAELVVHQRLILVGRSFLDRNLIPENAKQRFEKAVRSAFSLRNSVPAEVLLLAAVYVVGILIVWRRHTALDVSSWYAMPSAAGEKLSLAGMWYAYLSLPIFQFLLLRWYFRLFIWARFLWQVSRIDLSLIPTHPDRLGGLGFLSGTVYAFTVLLVAHGAMVSAQIADRIFYLGATLVEFKVEVAVLTVVLLCAVCGPLLVFSPRLGHARRIGLGQYGTFAERYVREFDAKWLRGGVSGDEPLLGSADIQSLADMANSFDVVRTMRVTPVSSNMVVRLVVAVVAPIAPLLVTMMPLETLLKTLVGLMF